MKWIKHMTATWDDERVAALVDQGGLALYGLYWRVQEIIAAQMEGAEPSCSVQYSVTRWSVLLSVRGSHVRHLLGQLSEKDLVTVEWIESDIRVTNSKLLKYRDEYARKSGHAPEIVRKRTEAEGDTHKEKEKKGAPVALVFPDWMPMEAWNAFVEMRKKERHPLTPKAVELAIGKLEKLRATGQDVQAILEESTFKGYRGLFPIESAKNSSNGHAAPKPPSSYELQVQDQYKRIAQARADADKAAGRA